MSKLNDIDCDPFAAEAPPLQTDIQQKNLIIPT